MEPAEYERMARAEDHHWWYLGMQTLTRALLERFVQHPAGLKILDAGCGTGAALSRTLPDYGTVTGIDVSPLAIKGCQARKITSLAQASVMEIPFRSGSFGLVTSFDVLYERAVASDTTAMREFFRVLRPGGWLLLRLPAYNWLRGQHDVSVHTARRYTASQVGALLKISGFQPQLVSYANTFLFPLALAKRLLERLRPPAPNSSDLSIEPGVFNHLFKQILASEAPLITRMGLPFGLSVMALGQKPVDS